MYNSEMGVALCPSTWVAANMGGRSSGSFDSSSSFSSPITLPRTGSLVVVVARREL